MPAASARVTSPSSSAIEVPIAATEIRSSAPTPTCFSLSRDSREEEQLRGGHTPATALEKEGEVVLPGEADAAVDLDRGIGDAPAGVARVGLGHRGRERQRAGV